MKTFLLTMMVSLSAFAARPPVYTELLDYVIAAPDQGKSATCIYVGSTGAMEILANKKYDLKHQMPGDRFDLSERFLIWQKSWTSPGDRVEAQVRKFNWGQAIHISDLPFTAYNPDGSDSREAWVKPAGYAQLPRMSVPKIQTKKLFVRGGKWDTFVLKPGDVELIKKTLWETKSPVLVNYNDTRFWHVITIIGYDDTIQDASCYETLPEDCAKNQEGAFYIRDSFGVPTELRDTDWFRVKGNAAFSVMVAD